jgi:protein gp37
MYRDKARYGQDPATVVRSKPGTFNAPLHWKDQARVFVCSWSDFFIEDADAWRDEAWEIMRRTPHLTYMLLTKRAENIKDRLPPDWPLKNVWLGVTAENQEQLNSRLPHLLDAAPVVNFVSIEPMLGEMSFRWGNWINYPSRPNGSEQYDSLRVLDWLICGGESGPEAREMKPEWAAEIKRQCGDAGVPFFMKQMSRKASIPDFLQGREFPGSI